MGNLVDFILEHERGGTDILNTYMQFLVGLEKHNRYFKLTEDEPNPVNLKELAQMPDDGFVKAYLNSRFLMDLGWGTLPEIKEVYEQLFFKEFPEDYQGFEVPDKYHGSVVVGEGLIQFEPVV